MYLTTQPYIDHVESMAMTYKKIPRRYRPKYPLEFNPDLAELFGYIVQCGTVSFDTFETNFVDCHIFTEMVERIKVIYTEQWNERPIRLNHRHQPRICGYKNTRFILAVCPIQSLKPSYERIPQFVFDSYEQLPEELGLNVIRAFLKALLGSAPKYWQLIANSGVMDYNAIRLFFRSGQLYEETLSLLRYTLKLSCTAENGTLLFDLDQLAALKKELNLEHPSWWVTNESKWLQKQRQKPGDSP